MSSNPNFTQANSSEPAPSLARLAYTIDKAARILSIGRTHLYAHIKAGRLQARKSGKRTLILARDLDAFLDSLEYAGKAGAAR